MKFIGGEVPSTPGKTRVSAGRIDRAKFTKTRRSNISNDSDAIVEIIIGFVIGIGIEWIRRISIEDRITPLIAREAINLLFGNDLNCITDFIGGAGIENHGGIPFVEELEVCDKRIKAGVWIGDGAGDHAGLDDVVGIAVGKVEAEKAGLAEDGNDLAPFAEDRLIGERIGGGESGAVIILEGAEHFLSGNDFDPGAGFIAGEERGHEESPTLEELVERDVRGGI